MDVLCVLAAGAIETRPPCHDTGALAWEPALPVLLRLAGALTFIAAVAALTALGQR